MSLELVVTDGPDFRNARFLAEACNLAYLPEAAGRREFRDQLGLDAALVSVGNTQAYVGRNGGHIVVAFRGSESPATLDGFKDWLLTNANNYLILPEGAIGTDFAAAGVGARFHRGFMTALAGIWDPLFQAVDGAFQEAERPVWVTGHSLGGALALLAAWRLQRNFVPVHQVYTFGAPMVGNAAAAAAFQKEFPGRIFRYVDDRDMVPWLPTVSLIANAYQHCLTEIPLQLAKAGGAAVAAVQDLAGQAKGEAIDDESKAKLWGKLEEHVTAHLMPNYMSRIEEKCKEA